MYRQLFVLLNCILVSQAYAVDTTFQVFGAGTVRSDGVVLRSSMFWSAGDNYAGLETRSYFKIPIRGLAGHTVLSASLRLYVPSEADSNEDHTFSDGFRSPDPSETLTLFDYQSDKQLLTDYTDQATVFADIGSGEVFGTALLTPAINGQFLTIALNAAGLSALQTAIDSTDPDSSEWLPEDWFVLGAAITTLDHPDAAELFSGDAYDAPSSVPEFTVTFAGPSVQAGEGSIRIDFGGAFGNTCSGVACANTDLGDLVGTDFSGTILVPQSGDEPVFVSDEVSAYLIDAPRAYLSFDAAGDAFDLDKFGPLRVQVRNCESPTTVYEQHECNYGYESLTIELPDEAAGLLYGFVLTAPLYQPNWLLTSSAIPPIEAFWNPLLYRTFYLCLDDYSECIDASSNGWEQSTLDYLNVSWVPSVSVDVQPWDSSNTVEPASDKLIAVAIHTTSLAAGNATDFDATQIDPSSLQLGSGEAKPSLLPWATDIDGDADMDMVFGFDTQDSGIVCGDTEVHLTGYVLNGREFTASDAISTAGCETASCH